MPIKQVSYDIPAEIAAGLAAGTLKRFGSVVRDGKGIIMHLKEVGQVDEKAGSIVKGLFEAGAKSPGVIAIGIGVVAAVGGAAYYLGTRKQRDTKSPDIGTTERYNASLVAYLEAITAGELDSKILKEFKTEVEALKNSTVNGEISVEYSHKWAEALNALLADYTRKLSEANSAELLELPELPELNPGTAETLFADIEVYLNAQQKIIGSES